LNDFTASNGIRVWIEGDVLHADHPADYFNPQTDGSIQALREFFRAEDDERLGRWRWPEDPEYVVYPGTFSMREAQVVSEEKGCWGQWSEAEARREAPRDRLAAAAVAYFDAHPEPKPRPWASADVITWRDGAYLPQIAQRDRGSHALGWYTWLGHDGRRLTEDALAQLIGDADVTILGPEES